MLSLTDSLQPTRDTPADGYSYVDELGVFVHDMFAVLVKETRDELADPTYKKYRHGRCGTNNRGCSGPMCRWARRVWQSGNAAARARMRGKKYNPRPSLEKQLTHTLMELFDEYVERDWLGRTTQGKIDRAVTVASVPKQLEPLRNLQTTEFHDEPAQLLIPVLM